jgi:predicted RNA-binding protein YlxR (DUF448 family)
VIESPIMLRSLRPQKMIRTRTCVGCGKREGVTGTSGLVRVVARQGGVEFDFSGRAQGRGAYVHARPVCLAQASRGLAKTLGLANGSSKSGPATVALATQLGAACERRIGDLLLSARRARAVRASAPQGASAGDGRFDPLTIVALDAGAAASGREVQAAVARGRAFAWGTQSQLGSVFGTTAVSSCTVVHESLAAELLRARAAADAASVARQEAMQRNRRPEAR